MKRTVKYALSAILAATIILPAAAASDNFPDVPENHWAFEALVRLKKDGLLVGYPDGLFRGNRPASRYELAVAIHACYINLKGVTDGLDSQIKALTDKLNGVATQADIQNLRDALAALQNEVNGMKTYGDDIAQLKKLSVTFEKELQALGVDVEAMKKDLGELNERVTRLEKRKPNVAITGDVNLLMLAGNSRDNRFGLDQDAHLNGVGPNGTPAGLTTDLATLEEGAFTFSGTNEEGPKWKGTLVVGNMLGTFGGQSDLHPGANGGYVQANADVYLQDFSVTLGSSIGGQAFTAELGRVAYSVSPYIFQRYDNTTYFANDRWDDGKYRIDGGILGFKLGGAKLEVVAGSTSKLTSVNGVELNAIQSGPLNGAFGAYPVMTFDRTLGATLSIPMPTTGKLNLSYLVLDSLKDLPVDGTGANRLIIYGGDVHFNISKVEIGGGYSKTDLQENGTVVNSINNAAWHAEGKYESKDWGIKGGYREIEANYLAPGDWGQLGIQRNPTNIKGWTAGGHLRMAHALTLKGGGEWDTGKNSDFGGTTGFDSGTKMNSWNVGLTWQVSNALSLMVGYQDTEFSGLDPAVVANTPGSNSASYKWSTFRVGYTLSDSAKLTLQYQVSDVSNDYQVTQGGGGRFTGGLLSSQLTIKF